MMKSAHKLFPALFPRITRTHYPVPVILATMLVCCIQSHAAVVLNSNDSGAGSLRQAVIDATPGDTITFTNTLSAQTITLTTGQLLIDKDLTIDASPLINGITISGNNASRVFEVPSAKTIQLRGLTVSDGQADHGGGIFNNFGILTLNNCTLSDNAANAIGGGGILNASGGILTLNNSTLSGNTANNQGGGIFNYGDCTLTLNNSTLSGNSAQLGGGGIYNSGGTLNSTNTIVAGNTVASGPPNVSGSITGSNNLTSGDPLLAPLGDYGGPTQSMPPLSGSPAIDAGLTSATNSPTDQLGNARVVGSAVDIGAVEWDPTILQTYSLRGSFNGWGSLPLTYDNDGTYSLTISDATPGLIDMTNGYVHEFKIVQDEWVDSWPGGFDNNGRAFVDADDEITVHFTPGSINDGWSPAMNRVGYADPGFGWEIMGSFNNWDDFVDTAERQMTNMSNGLYSVTYSITNGPGTFDFKFRKSGSWDATVGQDFGKNAANISITTTQAVQSVTFELDLPNGRYRAGNTELVTFQVDLSVMAAAGRFDAFTEMVECKGSFNDWQGGFILTNNPAGGETNIFRGTLAVFNLPGVSEFYRFTVNGGYSGLGWESPLSTEGADRSFIMPSNSLTLPIVFWSDWKTNDVLTQETVVQFTVDMAGVTNGFDGTPFIPSFSQIYLNGDWVPWWSWGLPESSLLMTNEVDDLYTVSVVFPAGHVKPITYKYSIDGFDNEASYLFNHFRYIRALTNYALPFDTFGQTTRETPAVIVTDDDQFGITNGLFGFNLSGLEGQAVEINASTNLIQWLPIETNTLGLGPLFFSDSATSNFNRRFYRLVFP